MSGQDLHYEESQFFQDLSLYFPNHYDIKVMAEHRGSLAALSGLLGVKRDDGCEHQAGSDSKITAKCLHSMNKAATKGFNILASGHCEIFGLSKYNKSPP
jgi:hypothetical protein